MYKTIGVRITREEFKEYGKLQQILGLTLGRTMNQSELFRHVMAEAIAKSKIEHPELWGVANDD